MDNEEIQGVKFSQFPSETPGNADEVVGLHAGDNARFSIANIIAAIRQGLANLFVPASSVGVADGVASLDSNGKVPSEQLPPIASTAADVTYDNSQSGLTADDVQEAIDELAQGGGGTTVVANPAGAATNVLNKLQVDSTIYSLLSGGTAITFPGFSTTEKIVGTWDGYPLYAKIFHQTLQQVSSAQRVTVSSENILIRLMLGTSQTQNDFSRVPLPYNGYLWAYQDGYTQIVVTLPNTSYNTIDFLLVYTKPSDSPAPTPGGVPSDSVSYDPTSSGSSATNVQDALDEAFDDLDGKQAEITASGILKGDGQGGVSAAVAGTDYQAPLTAGTDYATPAQLADKASKADLTSIQATGTTNTTGAAIPAWTYFYLNGVLHQTRTQIDVNATFTPGTNCVISEGFNSLPSGTSKALSANTSTTFTLAPYHYYLLIVGNANRTAAQSAVYILTGNGSPIEIKTSGNISLSSVSTTSVTVNTSVNTAVTLIDLKYVSV